MKKLIISLVLFCALAAGVFVLAFNVLNDTALEIDKSSWKKISNINEYEIVYSETLSGYAPSDYYETNPAEKLSSGLKALSGGDWDLDTVEANNANDSSKKIYCYNTNLDASENALLGEYDFKIQLLALNNIRIAGKTNKAVLAGVNFFLRECVVENNGVKNVYIPTGDGYFFDYANGSNKIDNVDISNFYIVIDDVNNWNILAQAQTIQNKICQISNIMVPIISETNNIDKEINKAYKDSDTAGVSNLETKTNAQIMNDYVNKNEIYISGYSTLRTDAIEILNELEDSEYYVGIKNGRLLILGQNALAVQEGCNYFISQLNNVEYGRYFKFSSKTISKQGVAKYTYTTNIFVDALNGNDVNSGAQQDQAVKTLDQAIKLFDQKKSNDFIGKFAKINIYLLDGNYKANNLIVEVPYNINLNIKAFGKSNPIIDSLSEEITLSEDSSGKYFYQFTDENGNNINPNIRQIYTTQNGVATMSKIAESKTFKTSSYVINYEDPDNKLTNLLSTLNNGAFKDNKFDTSAKYSSYPVDFVNRRIYIDSTVFSKLYNNISGCEEIWLEGEMNSFNLKIDGVGEADSEITYINGSQAIDLPGYYITINESQFYNMYKTMMEVGSFANRSYIIRNSLAYLGTGNNYVYDNTSGILYFASNKIIQYVNDEKLFDVSNSNNLVFENLYFTGVEYKDVVSNGTIFSKAGVIGITVPNSAAIYGCDVSNLTVLNCKFNEINSNAVLIKGVVTNLNIQSNNFTNIGMSAIIIGSVGFSNNFDNWSKTAVRNVKVNNNNLNNIGSLYPAFCGIFITKSDGLQVIHNTIKGTSYTAISVGYGDNWRDANFDYLESFNVNRAEIAFNNITDFVQTLKDGGAIYVCGPNCAKEYTNIFNSIHDNYAYNSTKRNDALICVYYLDGSASNWEVKNNVGGGGTYGLYAQYIKEEETHNIIISNFYAITNTITQDPIRINNSTSSEYISSEQRNVKAGQDLMLTYSASDQNVKKIKDATTDN